MRFPRLWCSAVVILLAAVSAFSTDYFVAPHGNDGAAGTRAQPWTTIARVNEARLRPGDRVLFRGGATFAGNLLLDAGDAGTPARPVTLGSYGPGRATIAAGAGSGIEAVNASGLVIENLRLAGDGRPASKGSGVRVVNTAPGDTRLPFLRIRNIEASGFGRAGIFVGGQARDGSQAGFEDVRIERCDLHDNVYYGILIGGPWDGETSQSVQQGAYTGHQRAGYTNRNVYVGYCRVWRNEGDPAYKGNHSGSGILVADTDGALVEHTVAWENGRLCTGTGGGPCGIWTASSNRVTIQYCEAYRNHTGRDTPDGNGFDLDGGVTNSVVQYNYSHDNDGYAVLLCSYGGAPHQWRNNVVRFNVSDNDGRARKPNAAILLWSDDQQVANSEIYNNTIIMNPAGDGNMPVVVRAEGKISNARFRNNLFVATSGCAFIEDRTAGRAMRFENNSYWTEGGPVRIVWAGREFSSLEAWQQATGQEMRGGRPLALLADPLLELFARGMTVGDAARLRSLPAYRLKPGSPLLRAGVPIEAATEDFFGTPLRKGAPLSVGAWQPLPGTAP